MSPTRFYFSLCVCEIRKKNDAELSQLLLMSAVSCEASLPVCGRLGDCASNILHKRQLNLIGNFILSMLTSN